MRSSSIGSLGGSAPDRKALRLRLGSLGREVIEVERVHEPTSNVGTSVAHIDTNAQIMCHVIEATTRSEVLVPPGVAHLGASSCAEAMAMLARDDLLPHG